jgi:hypothetical protein
MQIEGFRNLGGIDFISAVFINMLFFVMPPVISRTNKPADGPMRDPAGEIRLTKPRIIKTFPRPLLFVQNDRPTENKWKRRWSCVATVCW